MIKRNIPNLITLGNLFCGCLAAIKVIEGDLVWAAYLVGIAALLDFFDGFAARLLNAASPIGKDLDSLADMVTFGLVPGLVMFKLIDFSCAITLTKNLSYGHLTTNGAFFENIRHNYLLKYCGFFITLFSALRLAKFNNDARQSQMFIGLPTPANCIFICGFPLIFNQLGLYPSEINNLLASKAQYSAESNLAGLVSLHILSSPLLLASASLALGLLMVARLPLLSLKFKNFLWHDNKMRYILLALSLVMLGGLQVMAIPLIVVLYVLISIVNNIFLKTKL